MSDMLTVTPEYKCFAYTRRGWRGGDHYACAGKRLQRRWLRGRSGVYGHSTVAYRYDGPRRLYKLWVSWDWADLPPEDGLHEVSREVGGDVAISGVKGEIQVIISGIGTYADPRELGLGLLLFDD